MRIEKYLNVLYCLSTLDSYQLLLLGCIENLLLPAGRGLLLTEVAACCLIRLLSHAGLAAREAVLLSTPGGAVGVGATTERNVLSPVSTESFGVTGLTAGTGLGGRVITGADTDT